ncbi:polyketide synthase dehydratase domain-containing protein [Actinomadura keratinilytica]
MLPERGGLHVQVSAGEPDAAGRAALEIHTRAEDAPDEIPWTRHATGTLLPEPPVREPGQEEGTDTPWPPEGAVPVDTTDLYARFAAHGFSYGPVFHGLRAAWTHGDRLYAEVELPGEAHAQAGAFALHPALLDAALHAPLAVAVTEAEEKGDAAVSAASRSPGPGCRSTPPAPPRCAWRWRPPVRTRCRWSSATRRATPCCGWPPWSPAR